jgi:uncharacterized membrane protein HdeD (DUF308 family)
MASHKEEYIMASHKVNNALYAVSTSTTPWWVVLLEGIFALLLGIFLVAETAITSVFLVTVLGLYFLIRGIIAIVQIFTGTSSLHWGWLLFDGVVGIIAGLAVLNHPIYATAIAGTTVVVLVAVAALLMGIVGLIHAFAGGGGWGAGIFAALSILIAILLFANLLAATVVLPFVIAGFLIVGGVVGIVLSFSMRSA